MKDKPDTIPEPEEVFRSSDGAVCVLLRLEGHKDRDFAHLIVVEREGPDESHKEGRVSIQELRGAVQCVRSKNRTRTDVQFLLYSCRVTAPSEPVRNAPYLVVSVSGAAAQAIYTRLPKN